jgi:hypothetical protein
MALKRLKSRHFELKLHAARAAFPFRFPRERTDPAVMIAGPREPASRAALARP